jgi:hypothetical protein
VQVVGLEINAGLLRVVRRSADGISPVQFDQLVGGELPLSLALHRRRPVLGWEAQKLVHHMPHVICDNFLPLIGSNYPLHYGRHHLNADDALKLFFRYIRPAVAANHTTLNVTFPPYLTTTQIQSLVQLIQQSGLPLRIALPTPLIVAGAYYNNVTQTTAIPDTTKHSKPVAFNGNSSSDPFIISILDIDNHAFTASFVQIDLQLNQAISLLCHQWKEYSLRHWYNYLLDLLADRSIRQTRRDPRNWPDAEQKIFEQLPSALEHFVNGHSFIFLLATPEWTTELNISPQKDLVSLYQKFSQPLAARICQCLQKEAFSVRTLCFTYPAAHLPGLQHYLRKQLPSDISFYKLHTNAIAHACVLFNVQESINCNYLEKGIPLSAFSSL